MNSLRAKAKKLGGHAPTAVNNVVFSWAKLIKLQAWKQIKSSIYPENGVKIVQGIRRYTGRFD